MIKFFLLFFFIIFLGNTNANNKEKIINNLIKTENIVFEFEQNIDGKIENGSCTIQYPKKIFCKYFKNKILVSNGKSVVIKTLSGYYRYPLEKTPFNILLDKNFLIKKIDILNERVLEDSHISYTISENDNKIEIFFDNITFDLIGWQIKDIYQNLNITLISSIEKNKILNKNLFKLPLQN